MGSTETNTTMPPPEKTWWKEAIVYQIYPASFLDSNADGLGDLPGIISKLDYLSSLGINTIWLSPIFKSPQDDMGYDISDYRAIHEPYGTVSDVEELIAGLHARGIKILLDLVVNHTSDRHAWFQESRKSKESKKRDWYFWRDAKYSEKGERKPPNNWASVFGGSAWTWDQGSQQYYLSLFLPTQPDLNWANEDMRRATYADMEFWLQKGVDGYRIDSMNLMSKHPDLPDAEVTDPGQEFQSGAEYFASGPRMHEYIKEIRQEVLDKYDCMTVGELGFTKDEESVRMYVAKERGELQMLFTGDVVDMDFGVDGKYGHNAFKPSYLKKLTKLWQEAMPKFEGWNAVYLDNHDSGRSLSRYASDLPEYRETAAKMLATYLCTLSGSLFLLQGQEIGMANVPREWGIEDYIDVEGRNAYAAIEKQRGPGADMRDVMKELRLKARDNGRLPMQWNDSKNAGFTKSSKPWMRVNTDYPEWNVESQLNSESSVFAYYKEMLALRKKEADVFIYGSFKMLDTQEEVFAYTMSKSDGSRQALVLLNLSDSEQNFEAKGYNGWSRLIGGAEDEVAVKDSVTLKPYEGRVFCNW
ncbi:(Trans)glycosidase [Glarea lozoyensis ATCC 20868]|uniref:(Trans)glycosidase n=1 Tax=Glarea lozoyensis (strain ATCC 20868 / MF5171) TaxID=1116229 RepID=S3CMB3_GLAL2|nr:(Trans)glycosidase [Glarea lozoyensis ATCC 20868]EPE27657.1 (Trans)glycosidase [Glarea lozoyensis ATCC 20868]